NSRTLCWSSLIPAIILIFGACAEEQAILAAETEEDLYQEDGLSSDEINIIAGVEYENFLAYGGVPSEEALNQGQCVYVSIPLFMQRDERWHDMSLGHNWDGTATIGRSNGHLTCLAMLYKKWGYNADPEILSNWYYREEAHYLFSYSGNGDLLRFPEALHYPGAIRQYRNIQAHEIFRKLLVGQPVVAHIKFGEVDNHFVIIFAFDGQGFWIKDPIRGTVHLYGTAYFNKPFRVYGY
ncbi:C39 family peptidase, partial [bacterium]|nr:C39 family peptidase [bacterium]